MKLFCNLPEIAGNKEIISQKCEQGKWRSMEYRTKLGQGQLLAAAEDVYPEPVILNLNLKGWFKLYISLFDMDSTNYVFVKLSGDEEYTPVRQNRNGNPKNWIYSEYMEEIYWKCADMTNQQVILAKPEANFLSVSGLAWIRCEEMTEEEIENYKGSLNKENKCVQMHMDVDSFIEDRTQDKKEHFAKLHMLKDTNVDFCSLEYASTYDHESDGDCWMPMRSSFKCVTGKYTYDEMFKKYLDYAHRNGIRLYATERMSMAILNAHFENSLFSNNRFIIKNKQYYCKNRDGSAVNACSYAFEGVGDYVIDHMIRMVKMGFEGVSMIFHRGMHIGFEQPVIDRFAKLYPGVNPCLLPITDQRLHGVWCEFMTDFMRRVRRSLDIVSQEHIGINVITDYGLETSKNLGLDVECWAREGLIDSASQGDMETFEDLTDCMDDSNPEVIDLEKYKKRLEDSPVIKRNFCTNVKKVCQHMPEYLKLEELYGIKVYHVLPWVHTILPEKYGNVVEEMQSCGAKRFLAWNTNHMTWNLPEFHIVTRIGNKPDVTMTLRKFYRVLSLDNTDISQFYPNWRG